MQKSFILEHVSKLSWPSLNDIASGCLGNSCQVWKFSRETGNKEWYLRILGQSWARVRPRLKVKKKIWKISKLSRTYSSREHNRILSFWSISGHGMHPRSYIKIYTIVYWARVADLSHVNGVILAFYMVGLWLYRFQIYV